MKQMIEKKNRMLKEAGEAFREIWKIYRMLECVEIDGSDYKTLINLVNAQLGRYACSYAAYLEESGLYLPEAEEEPTEEEMTASREVNGDD